ncbi:MAG TPA: hypothetical protein VN706_06305 [Gemmatimonadaceae bacterium]|nr:hypothetical protein [Gemmatimonadaceae bacterium]
MKSKTAPRSHSRTPAGSAESGPAHDHYHREKARRAKQARPESEAMAAAKREYLALLAADAAKGKGGRPKKKAVKPDAGEEEIDETDESDEGEALDEK